MPLPFPPDFKSLLHTKTWLKLLGWVGLALVVMVVVNKVQHGGLLAPNAPAPALRLPLSTGELLELPAQGVTVLAFWAEWCGPCRAEVPELREVHKALVQDGGRVVGVSVNARSLRDAQARALPLGIDYPVAVADDALSRAYRVSRLPTLYVLRPDGTIQDAFVGGVSARTLLRSAARAAQGG